MALRPLEPARPDVLGAPVAGGRVLRVRADVPLKLGVWGAVLVRDTRGLALLDRRPVDLS